MNQRATEEKHLQFLRWVAGICLLLQFAFSLVGWNNSLLDHHGNRQTLTAITAYYFVHDGYRLDYITPLLGAPWSIPLEFPFYQIVTAAIVKLTGWPLAQTGRAVNLFFFYSMLVLLYQLVKSLVAKRSAAWLAVIFCITSPLYFFWSRTFMMESSVLCMSMLYLWSIAQSNKLNSFAWMLLASVAGSLAGASKITTFTIALSLGGMLCLCWWSEQGKAKLSADVIKKVVLRAIFYWVIPIVVTLKWTAFADGLKQKNILAQHFTSKAMHDWIFGNLAQRFTGNFHHIPMFVLFLGLVVFFVILWFLAQGFRRYFASFFIAFLLGPLVFTNLYIIHTYYWYESTVYLYAALGIVTYQILSQVPWGRLIKGLLPVYILIMLLIVSLRYLPGQLFDAGVYTVASAKEIQEYVPRNGVLLIYGLGWDATIPYYTQRRALMNFWDYPVTDPIISRSIAMTGKQNIQALVVGVFTKYDEAYFRSLAHQFSLTKEIDLSHGKGIITQYDVEMSLLNWNQVAKQLLEHGWARKINPVTLQLIPGFEKDKVQMQEVFGSQFQYIDRVIQYSMRNICFVR